jgi:DNA end-binding protein Ku
MAMAVRANWKGYLKLSLVSCAVALYPAASSSSRIRFNTLNRATGNRVKRQFVDAETGEPVESEDQVKGYQVGKGSYVVVEDEELEAIRIESTHTIDVDSFVPRDEVDVRYLDTPYYIAPDDKVAQEAFAVIRDAIREKEMAGLARVVIARREHMILLEPLGKGLLGTTLRFPYEVRAEKPYFEEIPDVKLPQEMRELAAHIVEKKTGHFDPSKFEDRYENAVIELVKSKQTGKPVEMPKAPQPSNVINLMDALRKSIGAERAEERSKPAASKSGSKSTARRKPASAAKKSAPAGKRSLKKAS